MYMTDNRLDPNFLSETGRYRAIFEQSLTANLILSSDGEILDSNGAACRMFGYDCDNLIGKPVDRLFDSQSLFDEIKGSNSSRGQIIGERNDGTSLVCDYQYSTFETNSGAIFGTLQILDITKLSEKTENLKLFESVVKGASDAMLIMKAPPLGKSDGAEIVFVNRAYTELTGYNFDELIGKDARFLKAPMSSEDAFQKLQKAIENTENIDLELLNYKKNGEEFWVHVSLSPVFEGEECTHFIASAKDITTRKNREQLKFLQSDISRIFNNENTLAESLDHTLNVLIHIGDFNIAEIWLIDDEKQTIGLMGYKSQEDRAEKFYDLSRNVKVFMKGEGLPGITWDTGEIQFWRQIDEQIEFVRNNEAHVAGLKTAYGIPIYFDNKVIGMLLLGLLKDHQQKRYFAPLLERLGEDLGSEIDRKQTEEQRNRFFSFSPDIICVAGMDGYFKQVNPAMSRLLGYSQDELLSHPISSFTHPDDRLKTEIEIDALNIDEGSKTFQNRYITKSGKVIWLSWTTRTFAEERKIYSIARDVTEQKELEMLLLQANKMSKFGRWEYEVAEQHTTWSDIVRQIHEVPPGFEPDLDKGIEFYKEGKSRDTISNSISEAIESAQSFDVELQIVTHKGNERWVRVIGDTEIVQGRVKRIYGSFQDIHQRKKAELKQQELSLERERILESIGDAFFAVNRDWTVTYWNSFAEEQLQMPRDKIVGENLWDVYQDATELEFYSQYHIAMREQVKVSFQQYYPTLEKWFDVSAYPSSDGLSVFFKDITDRKKTEQRLRELNIKLKQQADDLAASNAELEQFAFVASHDLQEPLRMVTSFLTQLEKKYGDELDEKAKRYIWFATDGARRMSQIILDLLNYSRIGRVDINPVQVDLNEVMEAVMRDFKKTVEEKDAEVNWDVLPEIVADRSTIHSLMSNLVSNAIKYHTNENRPVVNISSEETDFSWRISVLDNGIGISPEYSDEIFHIFKRLHTIDEYPGTGIGLSVCRKIVENHDGKIWLESSQSKGSTFTYEIPKSSDTQ